MTLFCVDTSAWHHSRHPNVAKEWIQLLDADQLGICDQTRLEILYSAQSAGDYASMAEELFALHEIATGVEAFRRALQVQQALAKQGGLHHRSVKIPDLIIAASAELAGSTVLHYDADYERIATITGQPIRWVAARGSL